MTINVNHAFVSQKGDGADPTLVQPSAWNANHVVNIGPNSVIGNNTAAEGPALELPLGSLGSRILAANVLNDLIAAGVPIYSAGDMKPTLKYVADAGWLMIDDSTIGNVNSGATYANANAQALYTLLWNSYSQPSGNSVFPVTGGLGASASGDWAAQKPLLLGPFRGRVIGAASPTGMAGTGTSARWSGATVGEETHTLSVSELPVVTPIANQVNLGTLNTTSKEADFPASEFTGGSGGGPYAISSNPAQVTIPPFTPTIQPFGGGGSHNNMQPTIFVNWMIKL